MIGMGETFVFTLRFLAKTRDRGLADQGRTDVYLVNCSTNTAIS